LLEGVGEYPEDYDDVIDFYKEHLSYKPILKRGEECTYCNTPDGDFIIDHLSNYRNIIVACGFSGHGFKFVSVLGEY